MFNKNFHSHEFSDQSNFIFTSFILHFMEYIKPEPLNCLNSYFNANNFNIEKGIFIHEMKILKTFKLIKVYNIQKYLSLNQLHIVILL